MLVISTPYIHRYVDLVSSFTELILSMFGVIDRVYLSFIDRIITGGIHTLWLILVSGDEANNIRVHKIFRMCD